MDTLEKFITYWKGAGVPISHTEAQLLFELLNTLAQIEYKANAVK